SRHSIGTGIVGGMTAATVLAIFFVPMFFRLFEGISEKTGGKKEQAPHPSPKGERELLALETTPSLPSPSEKGVGGEGSSEDRHDA
ncbi:MAG: efflux RND transporter permease subunit, partial [Candidatus Contendobacter sp.]|nr:efflux RND transporter permease subunit [Candidatus Contendobacter sp.]